MNDVISDVVLAHSRLISLISGNKIVTEFEFNKYDSLNNN